MNEIDLDLIELELTEDQVNVQMELLEERREIDAEMMMEIGVQL